MQRTRSKSRLFAIRAALIFACAVSGVPSAATPGSAGNSEELARIRSVASSFSREGVFSGSVLVARNTRPILRESFGQADAEFDTPNNAETRFRIASVTKQFTAAAILLLQERGKLSLTDRVAKYLPEAPSSWDHITIYNLLTHTSGLPNINAFPNYSDIRTHRLTPEQLIALFRSKPLEYAPGSKYSYGNSDYIVLGRLIERISGQSYGEFLRKNLFEPIHMTSTGVDDELAIVPRHARGYVLTVNGIRHADFVSMTVPFSAGNLYSTTGDLLKWENALFAGRVISAASLKTMTTPFRNGYGLGLFVTDSDGHRMISHTGDIDGFGAIVAYYPRDRLTVIVLSNLFGGAYGLVASDIAKSAFGKPFILPADRKIAHVPPATLSQYVGTYQLTPTVTNVISMVDGRLTSKIGNQAELEMVPESPSKFFFKTGDAQIDFKRDARSGAVTSLVVLQDGTSFEGKKVR